MPVEITPRGLAMHQKNGLAIARALIDIVNAVAFNLHIIRLKRIVGEIGEPLIRGADGLSRFPARRGLRCNHQNHAQNEQYENDPQTVGNVRPERIAVKLPENIFV